MKKNYWIFALILLVFASLACNLFNGLGKKAAATPEAGVVEPVITQEAVEQPTMESATTEDATAAIPDATKPGTEPKKYDTEFPLPADISGFTDMGNGAINFQAKISVKDAIAFYRDNFAKAGYKERAINTAITDTTFSLVFDGKRSLPSVVNHRILPTFPCQLPYS